MRRQWQILTTAIETEEDGFYQEGSSKGILLHHAKEWWQAFMTGTKSLTLLTDQASECSNINGQQSTKGTNRRTKREGKRIMLVDMSISMVRSVKKRLYQSW